MAEITGRHVLAVTCTAFGVIIAVNLTMAYKAVSTFPGLEVKNSYVASQQFDAKRHAQEALGWTLSPEYDPIEKRLFMAFVDGDRAAAPVKSLSVLIGRTTEASFDQSPEFVQAGGLWVAPVDLAPGKWLLRVEAVSEDGTAFSQRVGLYVKE